jgi:hypothetical protein
MTKFHLRWVSYALNTNQKAKRVSLWHGILSVLESVRSTCFQSVITGDESWHFLYYPRDLIWASSLGEVPERVNQKNNAKSV